MNRPFLKAGYVGLLVFAMSIVLLIIFPSKASRMPDGFFTPVIAFEFIETPAEVFQPDCCHDVFTDDRLLFCL